MTKHAGGRPSKLTPEVRVKVAEYLQQCMDNGKFPSVARLAVTLDISKKTLYNWGDEDPEFLHTLETLKSLQEATLLEGSLENKLNATIAKLVLSNHGYREKSEQDITSGGEKIQPVLVRFLGDDEDNRNTD